MVVPNEQEIKAAERSLQAEHYFSAQQAQELAAEYLFPYQEALDYLVRLLEIDLHLAEEALLSAIRRSRLRVTEISDAEPGLYLDWPPNLNWVDYHITDYLLSDIQEVRQSPVPIPALFSQKRLREATPPVHAPQEGPDLGWMPSYRGVYSLGPTYLLRATDAFNVLANEPSVTLGRNAERDQSNRSRKNEASERNVGGRPQRWPWGELKNLIRKQFELTRSWPHSNEEIKAIFRSMLLALGYSEEQDAALKMPGETQLKKYASELMSEINNRSLR